jgi:glycosyltransferase involved in cell wall biosynthesis
MAQQISLFVKHWLRWAIQTSHSQQPSGRDPHAVPPMVSVVIPAYNAAEFIAAALESVRSQTFRDYEIIVVNDGSPDTPQLERVIEPYRRDLIYIKQQNRGPGGARNAGILSARGAFIAFLDGDDSWLPEYLAEQVQMFRDNPEIDLHYMDALLFGDSPLAHGTFMDAWPSRGEATLESLLTADCVVITSCVVARRGRLIEAGLFDERFSHSEDFDLWVRLAYRGGRLAYRRRTLVRHRLHAASLAADRFGLFDAQAAVYRNLQSTLDLPSSLRSVIDHQHQRAQATADLERGKRHLKLGEYEAALAAFEAANRYYTSTKLRIVILTIRLMPGPLKFTYRVYQRLLARRTRRGSSLARRRRTSGSNDAA